MRLNWLAYNYREHDGYGRYSTRLIQALQRAGVDVTPHFAGAADAPAWMRERWGVDFSVPTISCLPPFYLRKLPQGHAPHWLLTMTEGGECPDGWADIINRSGVERVIVPCEWNAQAFRTGGVEAPISVIHGGTDPDEFALITERPAHEVGAKHQRPYTFLALADRGNRKGYSEVWEAFYKAFGGKSTGVQDVRLLIKSRPDGNALINDHIKHAIGLDPRLIFNDGDIANMRDLYALADCFAIPSRGEGWGLPHREASMCGLPVITQRYSGMDDGHTGKWALVVEGGQLTPVATTKDGHIKGFCRRVDTDELAAMMRWCYDNRDEAAQFGRQAARWLRANQTWAHSANALVALLQHEGVLEREYA
jgi:glycosyltransferase involved in cell wall biosynthesis